MTTATLKAQGKLITDIFEEGSYTRYAMTDDGRVFREGSVKRFRSKYVWIDDENGYYYTSLCDAYYDEHKNVYYKGV